MYTHRGMLAEEVRKQQRMAQAHALMGIPYVAPKKIAAAPPARGADGRTALATLALSMVDDPTAASSAAPKSLSHPPVPKGQRD
eukprot:14999019-Heterocapsa_arctica.AAC.1